MTRTYPTGIKIWLDDEDITSYIFGDETLELNDIEYRFSDIDLSAYLTEPGEHKLEITCEDGVGRVEARLEIK